MTDILSRIDDTATKQPCGKARAASVTTRGRWRCGLPDEEGAVSEPMPPENVRAVMADGREIPLDLTYVGFSEKGPDRHLHVWTTTTRLPEPPAELKIGTLPANTTIRLPMVTRRHREWNE